MANQVLPVSSSRGGTAEFTALAPRSAMNILQFSVRAGMLSDIPIGYVQEVSWSFDREAKELYQIEAIPDVIFEPPPGSIDLTQPGQYFRSDIYYPGEPVEVVPGYQKPISVSLKRVVMNSGTGLEALLNTGDAAEYNDYNFGAGYPPFVDLTTNPDRGIIPLQQVRPLTLTCMAFTPTRENRVIYGVKFIDGWITRVGGWNIGTGSSGTVVEEMTVLFPKVRLFR
ncbi:MAG: hypothetical protein ABIK31_02890 [candidate division WOR-3 bacterium]